MFEEQFIRKEFVSSADGTKDWYLVRKGRGNAPCILTLHGHGSKGDQLIRRPDVIRDHTTGLVEQDYSVISPNLRGNAWMNPASVRDLCQILQAERPLLNWNHLYCIAGSMGGTGALIFAMHHPEMVSGVGVLGGAADLNAYTEWLDQQECPILREINSAIRQAFPTEQDRFNNSVLYHSEQLSMPVLFYHGGADQTIPVSQARRLAEVMKNRSSFIYREIPGGNHDSPLPFFHEVLQKLMAS